MNRRTMILGTIGAAVGAAIGVVPKAVEAAAPTKTVEAIKFSMHADDKAMLAAFRRMKAEVEAFKKKLAALQEAALPSPEEQTARLDECRKQVVEGLEKIKTGIADLRETVKPGFRDVFDKIAPVSVEITSDGGIVERFTT
jgi:chromosome segregation ATPase